MRRTDALGGEVPLSMLSSSIGDPVTAKKYKKRKLINKNKLNLPGQILFTIVILFVLVIVIAEFYDFWQILREK